MTKQHTQTLRDLRIAADLRVIDVAVALNTSESRVRDWEKGRSTPRVQTVTRLAYVLGVSAEQLLGALSRTREQPAD